jgi:hypothetical protein
MICSNWTITFDPAGTPLVLLAIDQEMDGELEFPWEQAIEERRVIEGGTTEPLPRSWVKGALTFTAYKEHADDLTARAYLLSHRVAISALKGLRKTLRITPAGGSNTDISNAVFAAINPRMSVDPDVARTAVTYTLRMPW